MAKQVTIDVLTASACGRCQKSKALVQEVMAEFDDEHRQLIQYREINVVEEIDYAVQLGVLSTPAIALNGKLVFAAPPSKAKLRQAIQQRLGGK